MARVVIPGVAHHIVQRGNRRQPTFFRTADYEEYLALMAQWCKEAGVSILAYCLMRNHVHLIAVPEGENGFRMGVAEAHRRYTRSINFRMKWRGHLWQERFHSYPMDAAHLYEAVRYVELNPVRARIVSKASQYRWSSAAAHESGQDDVLVRVSPMLSEVGDWKSYLREGVDRDLAKRIEEHSRTGRPLGSKAFVERLEIQLGRRLRPQKPGRPKNNK